MMGYRPQGDLATLHTLARQFAVCDRWFASVPGPTWTNRLLAMSGTSLGRVEMAAGPWDVRRTSIAMTSRACSAGSVRRASRYQIYHGDFPLALLLEDERSQEAAKRYPAPSRSTSSPTTRGDRRPISPSSPSSSRATSGRPRTTTIRRTTCSAPASG